MRFKYESKEIPLSQINIDEEIYRITTQLDHDELTASIDSIGILHPPILKELNSSEFLIIAGFRRISAALALGWRELFIRVVPADTDNLTCSLLAIASNSLDRSLNLIELSKSFGLLNRHLINQDEIRHFSAALNLPYNPGFYKKMLAVDRLPETIQEGIVCENIALPSALLLEKMDLKDAIALSDLLKKLNLSLNKQRELIVLSNEIALRENIALCNVLASNNIQNTLSNPKLDHSQQADIIRNYLKARRFPNLTSAQNQFVDFTSSLALDPNLKLIPPPGFEGNKFILRLSFKNTAELATLHSSISDLLQNSKFTTYFKTR